MPRAFISYCRTDGESAKKLEALLKHAAIDVWRDQENIYAGQSWPKAIGDGIAGCGAMLLLWSKDAAESHFVEFEWNTAVALKKTIIPLLLDNTTLPVSLRAINAISLGDYDKAVDRIVESMNLEVPKSDPNYNAGVMEKLAGIDTADPRRAVEEAKSIFHEQGWIVGGNVYQASGNVTINIGKTAEVEDKKWWMKPLTRVAALVTLLTFIGLLLDLPKKIEELAEKLGPKPVEVTPLRGLVKYKDSLIGGAVLTVAEMPNDSAVTTSDGGFYFKGIPGKPGERVRLYVRVTGHEMHNEYVTLPGPVQILLEK